MPALRAAPLPFAGAPRKNYGDGRAQTKREGRRRARVRQRQSRHRGEDQNAGRKPAR